VERHSEYKDLINNAREKKVNKLTVLVHINAIKDASKKVRRASIHSCIGLICNSVRWVGRVLRVIAVQMDRRSMKAAVRMKR
jgi:hypothetical protein